MTPDERYMQQALTLAELGRGQTTPNPQVGAVIVKGGVVVGQGAHLRAGTPHAEIHALRMAKELAKGATVYVTLEPCSHHGRTPPCADALIEAGVARVVVAVQDPNPLVSGQGILRLQQAGIEVETGVLGEAAKAQNEAFFTWVQKGRPFVLWKCAATLDGYIAAKNGDSKYVTGPESRQAVHELRSQIPAIAVGIETVLADDPKLTARLPRATQDTVKQPLRVVFDSRLRLPEAAALLREPGQTVIYTTQFGAKQTEKVRLLKGKGADVMVLPADDTGRVPIAQALTNLGERGISSVLLEGGAQIVASFLQQKLIDKVVYYVAPKVLGDGLHAVSGLNPAAMAQAVELQQVRWLQRGDDLVVEAYPKYTE